MTTYVDEIKKVTDKPIKYLIYSHHHYDHIAGGKPFKDAGATIVAHKRAKERLARSSRIRRRRCPTRRSDKQDHHARRHHARTAVIIGLNHSDSTLVMRLPKEKIIFVVDVLPVGSVPGPRHDRLLSAGSRGLDQAKSSRWTGSA